MVVRGHDRLHSLNTRKLTHSLFANYFLKLLMATSQPTNQPSWVIDLDDLGAGNKAEHTHTYILAPDHARAAKLVFLFVAALEWLAFWGQRGSQDLSLQGLVAMACFSFWFITSFPCFGQDGFLLFWITWGEE
jgi:hypothetical protein